MLDPLGLQGLNDHVVSEGHQLSWTLKRLDGD